MDGSLLGKTFVVTGATSGIGLATAEALAQRGASIIGAGRSPERCRQAEERLHALRPQGKSSYCVAELSLQSQVRSLAGEIRERLEAWECKGLDGLLNNAGTVPFRQILTPEGLDTQWAVNHLAPFLLTLSLLPLLREAASARIVTVSSGSHYGASLKWDNVQLLRHYSPLRAYKQTKLCNVLFSAELDRRLAGSRMRAFAADPGLVNTRIGMKSNSILASWIWDIRRRGGISPDESARGLVYLLTEPSIQDAREIYWKHGKPKPPDPLALDETTARRLWDLSEKMSGIRSDERLLKD
jgi:NAD(P)-dependent dehydrogenase (short-subunit alcohol dehydrogenase family)